MSIRLKAGVSLRGMRPEVLFAINVADPVYARYEVECVVTAGADSEHSRGSLHYVGLAADLRTQHLGLTMEQKLAIREELEKRLGSEYDVVLEDPNGPKEHIHVEFQPKGALNA